LAFAGLGGSPLRSFYPTFANVHAQNFPVRPVRLIVNFPARSGTADAVARALGEYLTPVRWPPCGV